MLTFRTLSLFDATFTIIILLYFFPRNYQMPLSVQFSFVLRYYNLPDSANFKAGELYILRQRPILF